jgi:arabinoxylan arabinofuranohydrolase
MKTKFDRSNKSLTMRSLRNIITTLFVVIILPFSGNAQNPIIQTIYTADPAPMVYHDTLYLYTGHDEDSSTWFTMKDWRCYSTTDMVNWTDHGSPLSLKTFSWAKSDAWAGQCIFRNGKFYWYVPVKKADGKGMAIGVAVGPKPTGPFVDALGHSLTPGDWGDIDPTVFIDDDARLPDGQGQAYLYWGNPALKYVKLNEDMISYSGEIVTVPLTEKGFGIRTGDPKRTSQYEEGPWFYKRNGLYYLIYPAGGVPEHLAYSTSKGPTGPWVYQDTIMPIIREGGAFTNHPGIIDYKGKSYLFYHNGALPGGSGFDRSVCIEEFRYNEDGTIPMIKNTVEGILNSVSNLNPYLRREAETIAWEEGIETASDNETGVFVTDIGNSDYIKVRNVDFSKGAQSFEASVASAAQGGSIEIYLDSLTGTLLGNCDVNRTGSATNWVVQSCKTKKVKGIHAK